ncbi:DUF3263 domain-containing protein [Rhodococcus ruber]|uniref:DUF3263 domain-containing protein n=1 Tax=Rhodococcus ruber TaxID=1830 RepID=UPI00265E4548|nr:DUF3263 domain-containing protein [Rhodococcus ruber]MDO1481841.1 DUF3263 domain-containing protein [Rhodococcus ruber]
MTPDDRAMLDFVLRWSPFDDGDEYILPEFGLTPTAFYDRVLALVTTPTDEIDVGTCARLRDICRSKLPRPARRTHADTTSTTHRTDHHPLRATAKNIS